MLNQIKSSQVSITELTPYHPAYDSGKLEALTASMESEQWVGAPLVVHEGQLLTGSHRYAAARAAGLTHVPVVEFFDVFECEEEIDDLQESIVHYQSNVWVVELTRAAWDDNKDLASYLGLDAH